MRLPPYWGDESLSAFVDQAFKNVLATFVGKKPGFGLLVRIDQSFLKIGENLLNPPDLFGGLLLLRSHSAFRAACRLAMSGQIPEAFPVLRTCLEYSLYALHINRKPELGELWLRRHDDKDLMRAVRREFTHSNVMSTLRERDQDLSRIIEDLYERTIDFGGHPNERAITGSMILKRKKDRIELQQIYLHGDSLSLDYALKSTAQVGLGSLCVFRHIFRERFDILGVSDVIGELRRCL